jgi:hypothetical protein
VTFLENMGSVQIIPVVVMGMEPALTPALSLEGEGETAAVSWRIGWCLKVTTYVHESQNSAHYRLRITTDNAR